MATSLLDPSEIRGALPLLAFTQGDPAGIGPEILLEMLARSTPEERPYHPLLIAERAALEVLRTAVPDAPWDQIVYLDAVTSAADLPDDPEAIPVLDPFGGAGAGSRDRTVRPGAPGPADAEGALAALDRGIELATSGVASALVTCPLSKDTIHRHVLPGFVGHTDYLAEKAGLRRYGRDYLMAFLAPSLRVALLSTHLPLRDALDKVTETAIREALACLDRHAPGSDSSEHPKIAVAGLNPHAGEGGLLGEEEWRSIAPAIEAAREDGLDVHGPESPDSLFARALRGEFDWVLSMYHDQGLIAVKTAAFGTATNCTLGLPYLRTSVDHGTAYGIAGRGIADPGPLERVVETTLELLRRGRGS